MMVIYPGFYSADPRKYFRNNLIKYLMMCRRIPKIIDKEFDKSGDEVPQNPEN